MVEVSGVIHDETERGRVLHLAEGVRGVNGVEDRLDIEAPTRRRGLRAVRGR
jgi:osmotically-inducible protein OsmY